MTNTLILTILFLTTILTVHAQLPNSPQSQPPLNPSPQLDSPNSLANQQAAVISQAPSPQVSTAPSAQFTPAQTNAVNEPSSPLAALSQQVGLSQLLQTAKDAIRSATQNPPPGQPQQPAALNNPLPMNSNSVQTQQLPMMSNVVTSMPSMNSSPTQPQQQAALINNALPAMSQSNAALTTNSPTASVSSAAAAETNPFSSSVPQPTLSSSTIPNISSNGRPATESVATTTQSTAPTDNQVVETFQVNQAVATSLNPPQLPRFTRTLPRQDTAVINAANQQPLQTQQSLQTPSASSSMFTPLPQQPGVESVAAPVIESAAQPHTRNDDLVVQYDGLTQPIGLGVSRTPHFEDQDNMIRRAYANQHQYALQLPNPQLQGLRDSPYPAPQVPPPAAQTAEGQAVWMQQQQQALQDLQHVTRNPSQQLSPEVVHTNMETNQASPASDASTSTETQQQAATQTNNSN